MQTPLNKTAIILGATGLTGHFVLQKILEFSLYNRVVTIGRSKLPHAHPNLEQRVLNLTDFIGPESEKFWLHFWTKLFLNHPNQPIHVYSCLGSTIKAAGSQENFRKIDLEVPLTILRSLKTYLDKEKVETLFLVSSVGAHSNSKNFYLQTKGELEDKTNGLAKEIVIARPSLLLGYRSQRRLLEGLAIQIFTKIQALIAPIMLGRLEKYQPIHAQKVAHAFIAYAINQPNSTGTHLFYFSEINQYSTAFQKLESF